ncbi:transposase [Streptomyces sp. NPDC002206]
MQVRDRLGELFCDAEFARAFGVRGKPGWSPGRLALVTVLQKAQDLTDRRAADAVRDSLPWKYALGLALDDPGFDHSVLPEFRSRVMAHRLEEKVLDLLVKKLLEDGLLAAGGKQRTDSTHIVSAVRDLNRLELVGESVRACLEAVTSAAPHWVDEVLQVGEWSRRDARGFRRALRRRLRQSCRARRPAVLLQDREEHNGGWAACCSGSRPGHGSRAGRLICWFPCAGLASAAASRTRSRRACSASSR